MSIVDPDFASYSEESHQDIQIGEGICGRTHRRCDGGQGMAEQPVGWTYDEHGGYFDHVGPPRPIG